MSQEEAKQASVPLRYLDDYMQFHNEHILPLHQKIQQSNGRLSLNEINDLEIKLADKLKHQNEKTSQILNDCGIRRSADNGNQIEMIVKTVMKLQSSLISMNSS